MPRRETELPQIPWAEHTKVIDYTETYRNRELVLKSPSLEARIYEDGDVSVIHDIELEIMDYMEISDPMTHDLRRYLSECDEIFENCVDMWIEGKHITSSIPRGKKEWRPGEWIHALEFGKHGYWGSGYTNGDFKVNTKIFYSHFQIKGIGDGLVVRWSESGSPQVWIGDVEEFLRNIQYPIDDEDYEVINDRMENGLLWALDYFDVFADPDLIPRWASYMIQNYPQYLWDEPAARLMSIYDELPKGLQRAVRIWSNERMKEMEKATGQKYLWPEVPEP